MAYTFNGVAFGALTPDGKVPIPSRKLVYQVEHIAYSNIDIIDTSGYASHEIHANILVLSANRVAFEALLGVTAALVWGAFSGTYKLLELNDPMMHYDGGHFWYNAFWKGVVV